MKKWISRIKSSKVHCLWMRNARRRGWARLPRISRDSNGRRWSLSGPARWGRGGGKGKVLAVGVRRRFVRGRVVFARGPVGAAAAGDMGRSQFLRSPSACLAFCSRWSRAWPGWSLQLQVTSRPAARTSWRQSHCHAPNYVRIVKPAIKKEETHY
jgi:hypothetical protein